MGCNYVCTKYNALRRAMTSLTTYGYLRVSENGPNPPKTDCTVHTVFHSNSTVLDYWTSKIIS